MSRVLSENDGLGCPITDTKRRSYLGSMFRRQRSIPIMAVQKPNKKVGFHQRLLYVLKLGIEIIPKKNVG